MTFRPNASQPLIQDSRRATPEHLAFLDQMARGLITAESDIATLQSDTSVAYGVLAADYTLTSTTAAQKLFNWSATGALALATGRYEFQALISLTGLSATSGNGQWLLGGTATLANGAGSTMGGDVTPPTTVGTVSGAVFAGTASAADMVAATVATGFWARIAGVFNVTVAGTVIPQIALTTAAAGDVKAGSFFTCRRVGATVTQGTWT